MRPYDQKKAASDTPRCAFPGVRSAAERGGDDGLRKVEDGKLHGRPQKEPHQQYEDIHAKHRNQGRHGRVVVKDLGQVDVHSRASGNGRDKGEKGKDHVDTGEGDGRDLHQENENGEGVVEGKSSQDGGGELDRAAWIAVDVGILGGVDIDLAVVRVDGAVAHVGSERLRGRRLGAAA